MVLLVLFLLFAQLACFHPHDIHGLHNLLLQLLTLQEDIRLLLGILAEFAGDKIEHLILLVCSIFHRFQGILDILFLLRHQEDLKLKKLLADFGIFFILLLEQRSIFTSQEALNGV